MDRESDALSCAIWLRNRLSNEDPWCTSGIAALYTPRTLTNIHQAFPSLEANIKAKVLLSFLSLRVSPVGSLLDQIVQLGVADSDSWVRTIALITRDHFTRNVLRCNLDEEHAEFREALGKMSTTVVDEGNATLVPLEALYLHPALTSRKEAAREDGALFALKAKPSQAILPSSSSSLESASMMRKTTTAPKPLTTSGFGQAPSRPHVRTLSQSSLGSNSGSVARTTSSDGAGAASGGARAGGKRELLQRLAAAQQPVGPGAVKVMSMEQMESVLSAKDQRKRKPLGGPAASTKPLKGAKIEKTEEAPGMFAKEAEQSAAQPQSSAPQHISYLPPTSPDRSVSGDMSHAAPHAVGESNLSLLLSQAIAQTPLPVPSASAAATTSLPSYVPSASSFTYGVPDYASANSGAPWAPSSFASHPSLSLTTSNAPHAPANAAMVGQLRPQQLPPQQQQQQQQQQPPQQPQHQQQPQQEQPQPQDAQTDADQLFQQSNKLTQAERDVILDFVSRRFTVRPPPGQEVRQIVMHEDMKPGPQPDIVEVLQVVFELNYTTQQWRKVRRKKTVRKVAAAAPP